MPHGKDYVPHTDVAFDRFFKRVVQYSAEKCSGGAQAAWDHIPQRFLTALQDAYAAWFTAYSQSLNTGHSDDVKQKNRVRAEKEPALREFCQRFLKYDPVTAWDRGQMGFEEEDDTSTPVSEPKEHVLLLFTPIHSREYKLIWEVEETNRRARPYGYGGVVLVRKILEHGEPVPLSAEALGHSRLLTKNYVTEEFRPEDVGKRCAYSACWQNGSGKMGPWSDIVVVVIA